jgi:hypothetical protein
MPRIYPIVGAFYRPPAKLICESLPVGTPLFLSAEPDNAYDPNAIAVWVLSEEIPPSAHLKLEVELPNFGLDLDTFLAADQWHLGYVPKELAKLLKQDGIVTNDSALVGHFTLSNAGKPQIMIETD